LVNLHPGRKLNEEQVDAIVHLVASSVPEMPAKSVTIVDQDSNLLTGEKKKNKFGMDSPEMEYTLGVEQVYVKRIEHILTAITGPDNVRAQVAVELDFSEVEQTAEAYRPNPGPDQSAIRSQQISETLGDGTGAGGQGDLPFVIGNTVKRSAAIPAQTCAFTTHIKRIAKTNVDQGGDYGACGFLSRSLNSRSGGSRGFDYRCFSRSSSGTLGGSYNGFYCCFCGHFFHRINLSGDCNGLRLGGHSLGCSCRYF
jgi:hypothetical protein